VASSLQQVHDSLTKAKKTREPLFFQRFPSNTETKKKRITQVKMALRGKVAVVAGATRGAGRGIACMLGEAGW